ncbi:4-(cytidine 5'-diphospho)-2-C-methyl-D-erythritol kinase [Alteribacillus bidgolensis]|uniref:4-diphosphocytidyl-2-C-methyl-D-erythritol kinase n=1 Tax=Alteribacillus bidgolensis TaxID=930129 RepID=A0A1G8PVQ6_9BACI|nr:4-(cytidine 5'-diphospho)-2-C-methyl-D-erythritol kinase [Alteribacillus bidgolensis]SDI96448.1 4-diphosphocytidyl-2-C-methyl-D-erythritol kinase [Alteribacillus bidgolensis]
MKRSIKAPAKINLSLDVLHKREDGYHEVKMVMSQVDLADRLDLEIREDGKITIELSEGFLPVDQRNLAYQAASLLQYRYDIKLGVSIYIHKHIPVAAGLAGGSSDAAAVLKGLNELWEIGLSTADIATLGSEIGSDVSFCVYGGTALATGRGEIIKPLPSPPPCWVILAKPPIGVSTREIYQRMKIEDPPKEQASEKIIKAIESNDYRAICNNLFNSLEQVTLPLYPEVKRIKERMLDSGVDAALMSGSGPTVFGLVKKESRLHRVYNALRGFCDQVYAVRLISDKEA